LTENEPGKRDSLSKVLKLIKAHTSRLSIPHAGTRGKGKGKHGGGVLESDNALYVEATEEEEHTEQAESEQLSPTQALEATQALDEGDGRTDTSQPQTSETVSTAASEVKSKSKGNKKKRKKNRRKSRLATNADAGGKDKEKAMDGGGVSSDGPTVLLKSGNYAVQVPFANAVKGGRLLERALESGFAENHERAIALDHIDAYILKLVGQALCTGSVAVSGGTLVDLLCAADYLGLDALKEDLEEWALTEALDKFSAIDLYFAGSAASALELQVREGISGLLFVFAFFLLWWPANLGHV
jgi:hypothetical protein